MRPSSQSVDIAAMKRPVAQELCPLKFHSYSSTTMGTERARAMVS